MREEMHRTWEFCLLLLYQIIPVILLNDSVFPEVAHIADGLISIHLVEGVAGFGHGFVILCNHMKFLPSRCFKQGSPFVNGVVFIFCSCLIYLCQV